MQREHEPVDAFGRISRERHADHSAEREPAEGDVGELQAVEEVDDSSGQGLDRDGAVRSRGAAVARMVVADDAVVRSERGDLFVPERRRRAERAREHESAPGFDAVDPVREVHVSSGRAFPYCSSVRSTNASAEPR